MYCLKFLLKKALRSWDTIIECSWKEWLDKPKMCLVAKIASIITMIYPAFGTWTAKLIPHLIEKSSILVEVAFIVWWIVLIMMFWLLHIYEIEVATLFLILASEMTNIVFEFEKKLSKISLSFFWWVDLASISLQFTMWKKIREHIN